MADTKIQWADKVWNPISGCSKFSDGCANCYAESFAKRFWGDRKFDDVIFHEDRLDQPYHWKKPARIFVNSVSDLWHVDVRYSWVNEIFKVIKDNPHHTFITLTKRASNLVSWWDYFYEQTYQVEAIQNWWAGVTVESNKYIGRISALLMVGAGKFFVSAEPILDKVIISDDDLQLLDWIIVGGETGIKAREAKVEWVRSLEKQSHGASKAFFFKGWGRWRDTDLKNIEGDNIYIVSSRNDPLHEVLDGKKYQEFPV